MKLLNNISIVYALEDNKKSQVLKRGWVTSFHHFFVSLLNQMFKLGNSVELLPANKIESIDDLKKNKIIVLAVTENLFGYSKLMEMINVHSEEILKSDFNSRYFLIKKYPIALGNDLKHLANLEAYDFYLRDTKTGRPEQITKFFGKDSSKEFWMRLADLTYDIVDSLGYRKNCRIDLSRKGNVDLREKSVYLSIATLDTVVQRDDIKRELIRYGYNVYPKKILPNNSNLLKKIVKDDMDKCCMSIHLISEDYGRLVENEKMSVNDLQFRLALEYGKYVKEQNNKIFNKLVWISPDILKMSERQKLFIDDVRSHNVENENIEVLQVPIQEFKSVIKEELETKSRIYVKKISEEQDGDNTEKKSVYIILDRSDLERLEEIKSKIHNKDLEIYEPLFEGGFFEIRNDHYDKLKKCDATIIYAESVSHKWLKIKAFDILKIPGFGRKNKIEANAIVPGKDYELSKEDLDFYKKNKMYILEDGLNHDGKLQQFLNNI